MVSILIPAYNVEEYLANCLESILSQTYQDLHLVVIDDGSKDSTLQVMQDFAERDSRVEIFHQENQGVAETRNNLLGKVKGEYVLFVDADDWIESDMVEYLVTLAIESEVEFVMCDRVINDTRPFRGNTEVKSLSQEEAVKDFLHHEYFVGSLCNKLLSSNLLHNERFHRGISYGEDALFVWDILQKVEKIVVSNKQLYHYRMNEESITHQSFGDNKLSGHQTWSLITEDVSRRWPQYLDLARGTFGLQDMYLLRAASQSGYDNYAQIRNLQQTVRRYLPQIYRREGLRFRDVIYSLLISLWYGFGAFYYKLHLLLK